MRFPLLMAGLLAATPALALDYEIDVLPWNTYGGLTGFQVRGFVNGFGETYSGDFGGSDRDYVARLEMRYRFEGNALAFGLGYLAEYQGDETDPEETIQGLNAFAEFGNNAVTLGKTIDASLVVPAARGRFNGYEYVGALFEPEDRIRWDYRTDAVTFSASYDADGDFVDFGAQLKRGGKTYYGWIEGGLRPGFEETRAMVGLDWDSGDLVKAGVSLYGSTEGDTEFAAGFDYTITDHVDVGLSALANNELWNIGAGASYRIWEKVAVYGAAEYQSQNDGSEGTIVRLGVNAAF